MPKTSSVDRNVALFDTSACGLRNRVELEAGTISVSTDNLEASVLGVEVVSDVEGYNGGEISGKEVLAAGLEFPAIDLLQFLIAFLGQFPTAPINRVVGRNRMIDELNEGLCKNLAAFDQLVLHKCD